MDYCCWVIVLNSGVTAGTGVKTQVGPTFVAAYDCHCQSSLVHTCQSIEFWALKLLIQTLALFRIPVLSYHLFVPIMRDLNILIRLPKFAWVVAISNFCLHSWMNYFWYSLIPVYLFPSKLTMYSFQGDLTNIVAKTKPLVTMQYPMLLMYARCLR